ncbi:hypothetical protein NQZ68_008372 [Dissostichus eleginoides]|nr:hypothetical protein NQZ68_008372 [Dissostichus eleginoides]
MRNVEHLVKRLWIQKESYYDEQDVYDRTTAEFFVRNFIQDFWETSSSDPLPTFIAVKHVKKFISINRRKICQSIPEEILLLAAHKLKEACLQVTVRCPKQHFL